MPALASGVLCVMVLEVLERMGQGGTWNVHPKNERHEIIVDRMQRPIGVDSVTLAAQTDPMVERDTVPATVLGD